jgi:8-oxo-dGTP pyrophosphatase MutT (NUDIX family)
MKNFVRTDTIVQHVGMRFKREVVIKKFQTEDGRIHEFTTWSKEGTRAGAVIALTEDKQVIVVYQFRAGPERWMYDTPGGGIIEGEDPKDGVMRELREETGYEPGYVESLGTSTRDSINNTTWYYFLATDCKLLPQGRDLDEEEKEQGAEVQLISIDEFLDNAKHDRMTDPAAVLMAYDKLKEIAAHD